MYTNYGTLAHSEVRIQYNIYLHAFITCVYKCTSNTDVPQASSITHHTFDSIIICSDVNLYASHSILNKFLVSFVNGRVNLVDINISNSNLTMSKLSHKKSSNKQTDKEGFTILLVSWKLEITLKIAN